jgi:hypothetical protein
LIYREEKEFLYTCPIRLITQYTLKAMEYWRFYKKGFLPSSGGISQQSAKILQAFDLIDNEIEKLKEEEDKIKGKK